MTTGFALIGNTVCLDTATLLKWGQTMHRVRICCRGRGGCCVLRYNFLHGLAVGIISVDLKTDKPSFAARGSLPFFATTLSKFHCTVGVIHLFFDCLVLRNRVIAGVPSRIAVYCSGVACVRIRAALCVNGGAAALCGNGGAIAFRVNGGDIGAVGLVWNVLSGFFRRSFLLPICHGIDLRRNWLFFGRHLQSFLLCNHTFSLKC
mmetsp:Transcript_25689/g.48215  ORF Transcript_25689/g.48215 Transcript_25689/m.48215 type:complete len:205 (-) Transcript_25689:251-865(-)